MRPRPDHHRSDLCEIARRAMLERGLLPDFEPPVLRQVEALRGPAGADGPGLRDLTALPWASIDNDDSLDLDQLSVCEELPSGDVRVLVAVADVDALVAKGTPADLHARHNTTSVYTGAKVFPMLPARLSTDLTSLNAGADRMALVIESTVEPGGRLVGSALYRALVENHAKLAYDSVAAWLDGTGPIPSAIAKAPGVERQIRVQDRVARAMREHRHQHGVLDLEVVEARPVFAGEAVADLRAERKNRAKALIEDFMVASNGVTARFLRSAGVPSLRRVVRAPRRWDRIVAVAAEHGAVLPPRPDAPALQSFLAAQRRADPLRFPDLSLVIVKLLGPGEYTVERPGDEPTGHFGLAVRDYTHSTAPNRRYPDLVTHRQVKAALARAASPYAEDELAELARHCTAQEDAANKVERQMRKSAAALLLEHRVGERFDGVITGASEKGVWVRVLAPPVEGRIVEGQAGLEVGARARVRLVGTDVERGFIDFALARG